MCEIKFPTEDKSVNMLYTFNFVVFKEQVK